jgi:hypothetical protein
MSRNFAYDTIGNLSSESGSLGSREGRGSGLESCMSAAPDFSS